MYCIHVYRTGFTGLVLPDQAGPLRVEGPAVDVVPHADAVVAGIQTVLQVQLVRLLQRLAVQFDAQAGRRGNFDGAALDLHRVPGQALAVLTNPVRVQRGDLTGGCRTGVREHGQRNVEVVVRVRAPGQAELVAQLGHPHRTVHRPEVRVSQRNVHGVAADGMRHFPPVSGNHVGGGLQARGPAELRHDLAS